VIVYYYQCSPDSDSEISLKIGQYLMKLRRMKLRSTKKCASFFGHPVCLNDLFKVEIYVQISFISIVSPFSGFKT